MRPFALTLSAPYVVQAWDELAEVIRTGEPTYPGIPGVRFWDFLSARPEVIGAAKATITAAGVRDRCDSVGRDFSAAVPAGRVAHVLARILYDRPDAEATAILRACRWSMAPGARRWIVE